MLAKDAHTALRTCRPGFLLLVLTIAIAIGVLLSIAQLAFFFKPLPKYTDPNALPWEEKFLIRNEALYGYELHRRQEYSAEQPKITEAIRFESGVYEHDQYRGEIEFGINTEGTVKGSWSAAFTADSGLIHYTTLTRTGLHSVPNSFRGNIAPSKIYEDKYGQDKSKLYVIAEGRFLLGARNLETNKASEIWGDIYLTGWLDPEYNAVGKLIIVPECFFTRQPRPSYELQLAKETWAVFEWGAEPLD